MNVPTPPAPTPEEIAAVVGTTQRWWKDAECLDATIDGFDSDDGSPEAKAACSRCPVRLHCLADEVRHPTDWVLGFRGGLQAPERRVLITRASALVDHGPDEVARLRAMRDAGLTVEVIAEVERTSPRTIYRRLAEASDASSATRTDVA